MPRIDAMFAFVTSDKSDDDEGVVGTRLGDTLMPLIGADLALIRMIRPIAQAIADQQGKEIRLIKFTDPELIETLTPKEAE